MNNLTADFFVKSVTSTVVLIEKECPIDMMSVVYDQKRIELFGTLYVGK